MQIADQELQETFMSNIRMKKTRELSDFNRRVVVSARRADLEYFIKSWDIHTSQNFPQNAVGEQKTFSSVSSPPLIFYSFIFQLPQAQ